MKCCKASESMLDHAIMERWQVGPSISLYSCIPVSPKLPQIRSFIVDFRIRT